MMRLIAVIQNLLFPEKCILCGKLLDGEMDICRSCRQAVTEFPKPRGTLPFLSGWTALWYYSGDVRKSILRYKFRGRAAYVPAYGRMLGMKILRDLEGEFDMLTWVPVSRLRRLRRGYDQVELIAEAIGKEIGMEPVRLLRKIRNNPPQSGLTDQAKRRANVLGVYRAIHPEQFAGKRILLIDDIVTTGATAGECARVLLTAGAAEVYCAALAAAHHEK